MRSTSISIAAENLAELEKIFDKLVETIPEIRATLWTPDGVFWKATKR